jgi:hypothetical protein
VQNSKCEECVGLLHGTTYSSQDGINICKASEKKFQMFQAIYPIKVNKQKVFIEMLRQFEGGNIFIYMY